MLKLTLPMALSFLAIGSLSFADTVNLAPDAVSQLDIAGTDDAPTVSAVNPATDTIYTRARDFVNSAVRGNLAYIRFDLSSLSNPSIQSARFTLTRVGNDSVVTGRVALHGLLNVPGNAPQDWDANGFSAGDEFDVSMFADDVASVGASPVNLANVADFSVDESVSGNTVTLESEAFVQFIQERADDNGLVTLLLNMPSQGAGNDKAILYASSQYADEALRPNLEIVYFDANLPSPPENLAVTNIAFSVSPSVTLAWDNVAGALSYKLYRREAGETDATLLDTVSTSTLIDANVSLLGTYYYSVAVVTDSGESIPSPEIVVNISDPGEGAPEVPAGISLSVAETDTIGLGWDASAGAIFYDIHRSDQPDRGYTLLNSTTTNSFVDAVGIESYQTYYYIISATGAGGMSAFSPPYRVDPRFDPSVTPPANPGNPSVVQSDTFSLELSWDPAAGAEGYYVYRSTQPDRGFHLLGVVETNSILDDYALYPEHPYYYEIYAVNSGGFSEQPATFQVSESIATYRRMENLTRAPVAVETEDGVYVGWRMLGTDPATIAFNLYRDGLKLNSDPVEDSTNFLDAGGNAASSYEVRAVIDGVEMPGTSPVNVLPTNYLPIPLQVPVGGTTPDLVEYTYSANDASVADLDGDNEYEIILKWDPSNAQDNSNAGYTGNVYIDAYKLDGTLLWRIDLGRNIRAGAHYTQLMVYDLDGDGRAEVVMKTADGTIDGMGTVIGDPNADWRNEGGWILEGPEFLTVFDGMTGAILDTIDYVPPRGNVIDWGDDYGNRVDRFLAGIAYFDGVRPSYFTARGQYYGQGGLPGRTVIAAYDLVEGNLVERWVFDTNDTGQAYAGQGHHQLSVGDADADGRDEIMYGGMVIDDDGTGLYTTQLGTGDAMHFGDLDPTRPGLELFAVKEDANSPVHVEYRDPATGELIWGWFNARDTGRGLTADIDPTYPGAELWGAANVNVWSAQGDVIGTVRPSINFATWWDGDLLRELTDGNSIRKWDYINNTEVPIMVAEGAASNNGTKANSSLQADLLGDWREEVIFRSIDSSELRVYTTTDLTDTRIHTLMHDPMYRLAVAWQNNGYNQPPHPSFFIGNNMPAAPEPNIFVNPVPEIVGEANGSSYQSEVQVFLNVNGSSNLQNQYQTSGGSWIDYVGPFTIDDEGSHEVAFRTLNAAGDLLAEANVSFSISQPVDGDLDGDGDIDNDDRMIFQGAMNSCEGDPNYLPAADYNGDGCIDKDDFRIWQNYFRLSRVVKRG